MARLTFRTAVQRNGDNLKASLKSRLPWVYSPLKHWIYAPMKRWVLVPTSVSVGLYSNYLYDLRRFGRSAGLIGNLDREMLYARITMDYHRIEKGLALQAPRVGFGADVLDRLLSAVPLYESRYGSSLATRAARGSLREYVSFHLAHGMRFPAVEQLLRAAPADAEASAGGTVAVRREDIQAAARMDFVKFAHSRFSVRQFTGEAVSREQIELATLAALKSPSVCNRQSWRVHLVQEHERMKLALSFQNGNRGFGDHAGAVLIVTSDMRGFASIGERNQCWIDGGLFAMSLVYALHAQGLGTCMLNWSAERDRDAAMRAAMDIPDHEGVIMMMAVGVMPETFSVASSPRRQLDEVLRVCGKPRA